LYICFAIAIAEALRVFCRFNSSTSGATGGWDVYISLGIVVYGTVPTSLEILLRLELVLWADVAALRALATAFASSGYASGFCRIIGWDSALFLLVDIAPVAAKSDPCRPIAVWP
jgi:hypothetical protein